MVLIKLFSQKQKTNKKICKVVNLRVCIIRGFHISKTWSTWQMASRTSCQVSFSSLFNMAAQLSQVKNQCSIRLKIMCFYFLLGGAAQPLAWGKCQQSRAPCQLTLVAWSPQAHESRTHKATKRRYEKRECWERKSHL